MTGVCGSSISRLANLHTASVIVTNSTDTTVSTAGVASVTAIVG
jgi:hypothetical protein